MFCSHFQVTVHHMKVQVRELETEGDAEAMKEPGFLTACAWVEPPTVCLPYQSLNEKMPYRLVCSQILTGSFSTADDNALQ